MRGTLQVWCSLKIGKLRRGIAFEYHVETDSKLFQEFVRGALAKRMLRSVIGIITCRCHSSKEKLETPHYRPWNVLAYRRRRETWVCGG